MLFGDGGRASLLNNVVWKLESTDTNIGGSDFMEGNAGSDIMLGGAVGDEMHGDAGNTTDINATLDGNDIMLGDNTKGALPAVQFGAASARPGSDLEFGDHGRLYPQHSFLPTFPSRNFFSIDIGFTSSGAGDKIYGN